MTAKTSPDTMWPDWLPRRRRWLGGAAGVAPEPDLRSRRMVVVIECILNQNVRDPGAASFAAMNEGVVMRCAQQRVGIVQMPCPEVACLGPARRRGRGQSIRDALDTPAGRAICARLADDTIRRLGEYRAQGHEVLAVLGGNAESPGCAVVADGDALAPRSGLLMRALAEGFAQRGIDVPFRGIRDADAASLAEDLAWLDALLQAGGRRAG